jgi:hypothetical protein
MTSVPKFPPYDDPVWDGFFRRDIPDDEKARMWAEIEEQDPGAAERLGKAIGRILIAAALQLQADDRERDDQSSDVTPSPTPKRTRRLKPSSIAAWEAQWQAEHAAEAES